MSSTIAIGFDFDHTLGIDNKIESKIALEMLASLAAKAGTVYEISDAQAAIDGVLEGYRKGELSLDAAIAGFFERFAPSGSAVREAAQDFRDNVVARVPEFVRAQAGAESMLSTLDAMGVRYALLTNGWSPLQEEKARTISFRGSVFVSERINARKPAREAFDVLAKHFEMPLRDVWYVGDDPVGDIAGAGALGMTTVWYDGEGRAYPRDVAPPTHTIRNLADLPALLQGRVPSAANPGG